jgi:hypothetical protein
MVQDGFYSNRTDFIRTAIRNQIQHHSDAVTRSLSSKNLDLGLRHLSREELESVKAAGGILRIRVLGLVRIAEDVSPELALATIATIHVLGAVHASPSVRAALSERIA